MTTSRRRFLAAVPLAALGSRHGRAAGSGDSLVYIGTGTRKTSKGIYVWRFRPAAGELEPLGLAAEADNPTYLAIHPNGRFLFSVNEVSSFKGSKAGAVSAFSIDRSTGRLTLLNQASSRGALPCYVAVDKTGRNLLLANFGGGSVAVCPIGEDGRLAEATAFIEHTGSGPHKRQTQPFAHFLDVTPDNRFAMEVNLGLDRVFVYRFDAAKGALTPHDPPFASLPPGSGPRHLAFHPNGKFVFVINEIAASATAFAYDASRGSLTEVQTVSLVARDYTPTTPNPGAAIGVHPNGRFLYVSLRGPDSIAALSIDSRKGALTPEGHTPSEGKTPWDFRIDPSGAHLFVANHDSGAVAVLRLDPKTGRLTSTGRHIELDSPRSVKFLALA
jgi:6-phosphogluconolactonase